LFFLSNRDRKANHIAMLINALISTGILFILLHHANPMLFIFYWFVGIFAFQIHVMMFPRLIQLLFFNALHPKDEQKILERKIACLQEEIKRINGEDYNEDIFHDF
jgi:hypothetical protein